MSDIVERLRKGVLGSDITKTDTFLHSTMRAAADEIEKLRAALRLYADDNYNGYNANGAHARAVLGEKE